MSALDHTYAVILAGGGGTRLWPKSRKKSPKQFLKLVGKQTMLQVTASRMSKLIPLDKFIIVTNKLYEKEVRDQLPEVPVENIISEPEKKDTALAMLVGSLYAKSLDPKAIVVNAASDHVVTNEKEFIRVMKAAVETAASNEYLISVGITPTFPSTGFGYIKIGEDLKKLDGGLSLFKVDSFTEKPNKATAGAFISTGKYFWNANMYVWSAKAISESFDKHMPKMHKLSEKLATQSAKEFHKMLPNIYKQAESISIDYAISEKASNLALIPGDFGWNDVGDWGVVYDLGTKDLSGNVVVSENGKTEALSIKSHNNLLHTNNRLIAVFGVDDLVIVDTDEILMIAPKGKSQEVKELVNRLKEESKDEYL
ncbi:MAG: NTP transferase domain-containing protein [Candidatus Pacebacteria bacterium]|jgi:mannose-1-phosphate guanylyltransferase|nr:NTP transferase domain-containing protein [Candidatus Paceibacterota bacterium]MBT3512252.1 NTP transferase domain-containing protein [Candidatus Paceibacterota bacterium]MBT4004798.1 NTP transferase domain-containing protein [Candidatus Paceibacterota bacterium]MBT4358692.1 NTP transferase domain-containing protein [Candidatus Paceibacterota bacterium]MBT4681005.1 NTP transferase domain-containing protein [Candidatus Paceibacterota bacterium]